MRFLKPTALAVAMIAIAIACNQESTMSDQSVQEISLQKIVNDQNKTLSDSTEQNFNTEDYDNIVENEFLAAIQNPLSTFSIDVDEAAYSNVRRYIQNGSLPPAGAVR